MLSDAEKGQLLGPKPRSQKRQRPAVLSTRVNSEQLAHVVEQASRHGESRSAFLQRLVLQDMDRNR